MVGMVAGGSEIRKMFEEGARLAKLYGKENVFDFSLGNPNFPPPQRIADAIVETLELDSPVLVHGYMSNSGYEDVRDAVAQDLNKRFKTHFSAEEFIMTVGAGGALNVALNTLLDPGDEVVIFAPYFLEYGNYIRNFDGVPVIIPANIPSFMPDIAKLREVVTEKTKAVIINSPNNPTGVIYPEPVLAALGEALRELEQKFGHSIYLISDEPYRELAYDGACVPFATKYYHNTIVGYSWSKSLSLPGERIGYLLIPKTVDDFDLTINAATISNRILGFVNAPSLIQRAVMRSLDCKAQIGNYDRNRQLLYDGLTELGFECVYPSGAFYLWMKTPGNEKEFVTAAQSYNILIVGGTSFACPGYARLAYCVSPDTIINSMAGFKKLAERFSVLPKDE
jgi:aspartate aminotransferase